MIKIKPIFFIISILIMSFFVGYFVFADWQEAPSGVTCTDPIGCPPGNNVPTPINQGSVGQTKSGDLRIDGGFRTSSHTWLATGAGNVGIGTTSPTQKLHVTGTMRLTSHFFDVNNSSGVNNQVLTRTSSGPAWQTPAASGITGSGSTDYVPLWTGSGSLGNSVIRQTGSSISIGGAPSTTYKIYAYAGSSYGIRADGSTMGGYFYNTNGTSYAYLAYSSYGIYANSAYFTGNISAPSNTREDCAWTSWTCNAAQTCPNPQWMVGVERGTTLSLCGSAPTRWYQMRLYCCNL